MASITFDHLYGYDELTTALHSLASEHPTLLTVESIGRSHEGRDIWLATVTNQATGNALDKPAIWVDANIHSDEHTGSVAALHLVHTLLTGYGTDAAVTRCVDTRTCYVVPRVNPDGAELALAHPPTLLRSSVRPWPRVDDAPGLVSHDLDGDGRVLTMRIVDPNGPWKTSDVDPRLLVARAPDEFDGGPFYRLLPEGTIREFDGATVPIAPERRSLDLNRQFPAAWRPHGEQPGAGPFPLSEPETRAVADALVARPNVCCYFAHHTFSAAILRPFDDRPDDEFPTVDLQRYKVLGARGSELTGYPHVSVFHDFRYDPKDVISGGADTWAYDHLGAFAWTTEFWSPLPHAGITGVHLIDWFADHPIDDERKLLAYSDSELGGTGFVDWYEVDHPQLGRVELGGWDLLRFWFNPPDALIEAEITPHAHWQIFCALSTPQLAIRNDIVDRIGPTTWRVRIVVQNEGWLPTAVTQRAIDRKLVQPVRVECELPAAAQLRSGTAVQELGHLPGRSRVSTTVADFGGFSEGTPDLAVADWTIEAPAGTTIEFVARHERAGTVRRSVLLDAR